MANRDSAIEMADISQSPVNPGLAGDSREGQLDATEPLEEDVFLPATPVSKFTKIPGRAHSTPRPAGSRTDSDAHFGMGGALPASPNHTGNYSVDLQAPSERDPLQVRMNLPREPQPEDDGPKISPGHKQFLFCLALFVAAVLVGFMAGYFVREKVFERESVSAAGQTGTTETPEPRQSRHQQAIDSVSAERIANYASSFSQVQCTSSTPCSQSMSAEVVKRLKDIGLSHVDVSSYDVLTSHPDMSAMSMLQMVSSSGDVIHSEVLYGSEMEPGSGEQGGENVRRRRKTDGTPSNVTGTSGQSRVMYMPFSASGQVQGELVYVHHASEGDFLMLSQSNINVKGKIGIARQGTMMVTEQVKNVQTQGMMGLILYTDPADMDVVMTMGTDQLVGMIGMMGDPLTPGCPSMDGIHRMPMQMAGLPSIPVQPVSADLAASLLGNMTGRMAPDTWKGGLETTYYMGLKNTKKSTWTVRLDVNNMQMQQPVHDVIATIQGTTMPDEYIILGGHFPSMMSTMGGMTTPADHGSLSMLMETATVMGQMMTQDGWRPQRSVVLGMWGGAEYGHAGSVEWAEEHRRVLSQRAVSYIDLDMMMGGGEMLVAKASPLLKGIIMQSAEALNLTDMTQPGQLTGVGDHVAFSHMLGIPSAQLHAAHDMTQEGSAMGSQHSSMSVTKLATRMVLTLADSDVIPFDASAMGEMLVGYVDSLDSMMGDQLTLSNMTLTNLKMAAADFMSAAADMQSMMGNPSMMQSSLTMTMVNHRLMYMERSFVDADSSGSMMHVLYGMTEMDTFPLVAHFSPLDMNNETMTTMMERISVIQCSIQSATLSLKMDFS